MSAHRSSHYRLLLQQQLEAAATEEEEFLSRRTIVRSRKRLNSIAKVHLLSEMQMLG